jgi:short-subunit dehydrogenase
MKRIFVTGGSSGIGQACCELLAPEFDITAPTRSQYDLSNLAQVDQHSLKDYDIVINCAGVNVGTYLGFHANTWQNQSEQVQVNFVAPLLMAKRYTQDREQGQFIYISSVSADDLQVYNIFNGSSKLALRSAINTLAEKFQHIKFTEICPGRTRTNMLHQNYAGSRSREAVEQEYDQLACLSRQQVAESVRYAILNPVSQITIRP